MTAEGFKRFVVNIIEEEFRWPLAYRAAVKLHALGITEGDILTWPKFPVGTDKRVAVANALRCIKNKDMVEII